MTRSRRGLAVPYSCRVPLVLTLRPAQHAEYNPIECASRLAYTLKQVIAKTHTWTPTAAATLIRTIDQNASALMYKFATGVRKAANLLGESIIPILKLALNSIYTSIRLIRWVSELLQE